MRSETLLGGPTCAKFIGWCDLPEPYRWISGYPPMHLIIFIIARVHILVIDLISLNWNFLLVTFFFLPILLVTLLITKINIFFILARVQILVSLFVSRMSNDGISPSCDTYSTGLECNEKNTIVPLLSTLGLLGESKELLLCNQALDQSCGQLALASPFAYRPI